MNVKELIFGGIVKTAGGGAWRDSIQAWLPIKNIVGGVVVTRDNRFVKILEVLPVNIYLNHLQLRRLPEDRPGQSPAGGPDAARRYRRLCGSDAGVRRTRGQRVLPGDDRG